MDPADLDDLRRSLPEVRWEDVRFHDGVPAALRWKGARAMALPSAWHPRRVHVHVATDDPAILRHEAVHVRQYQDLGPGLGYLRPFVVAYLGWVPFRGTGPRHPLEAPAYALQWDPTPGFWRLMAGQGRGRWLAPLRLALGVLGALAALLAGPLVELSAAWAPRGRARGRRPPPRP